VVAGRVFSSLFSKYVVLNKPHGGCLGGGFLLPSLLYLLFFLMKWHTALLPSCVVRRGKRERYTIFNYFEPVVWQSNKPWTANLPSAMPSSVSITMAWMTRLVRAHKHQDYETNRFAKGLTCREASVIFQVEHCSPCPNLWQTQQTLAGKSETMSWLCQIGCSKTNSRDQTWTSTTRLINISSMINLHCLIEC